MDVAKRWEDFEHLLITNLRTVAIGTEKTQTIPLSPAVGQIILGLFGSLGTQFTDKRRTFRGWLLGNDPLRGFSVL